MTGVVCTWSCEEKTLILEKIFSSKLTPVKIYIYLIDMINMVLFVSLKTLNLEEILSSKLTTV